MPTSVANAYLRARRYAFELVSSVRNHSTECRPVAPYRAHGRLQSFGGVNRFPEAAGHDAEFVPEHFITFGSAIIAVVTGRHRKSGCLGAGA
jgi:hypothetical protein